MAKQNGNEKSLVKWIWDAACSIHGAKEAPKHKDYILPLWNQDWFTEADSALSRRSSAGKRKKSSAALSIMPNYGRQTISDSQDLVGIVYRESRGQNEATRPTKKPDEVFQYVDVSAVSNFRAQPRQTLEELDAGPSRRLRSFRGGAEAAGFRHGQGGCAST